MKKMKEMCLIWKLQYVHIDDTLCNFFKSSMAKHLKTMLSINQQKCEGQVNKKAQQRTFKQSALIFIIS